MGEVVECLIKKNLMFPVALDQTTKAWEGIDAAFQDHLSAHGFDLKRHDGDDGSDFNKLWDIMTKRKAGTKSDTQGEAKTARRSTSIEFVSKEATYKTKRTSLPSCFLVWVHLIIFCCHLTKGPVPSSQLGIRFTGQNLTFKTRTMNGPDVSLWDIIKFFGEKTPAGFQRAVTSPATFQNYRTCYLHVQSCIRAVETRRENLSVDDRAFLELLEKLLNTEYTKLDTLIASQYGRLKDFQVRVVVLNNTLKTQLKRTYAQAGM